MRALIFALALAGCGWAQALFPFPGGGGASGGPPSYIASSYTANVCTFSGTTCTLGAFSVAAGRVITIAIGFRGAATDCATITSITGAGSDSTSTPDVTSAYPTGSFACVAIYTIYNATASGSYTITLHGTASAPSALYYALAQFSKGSLTGTVDKTCSGNAAATSVSCSASMTPAAVGELGIAAVVSYDPNSTSMADASSPSSTFALPGASFGGSTGSIGLSYFINTSTTAVTPGFSSVGAGDAAAIGGFFLQ